MPYRPLTFLVGKRRDPRSIKAKLFLPIIPIGIVAYAFLGQPLSKQLYINRNYILPWLLIVTGNKQLLGEGFEKSRITEVEVRGYQLKPKAEKQLERNAEQNRNYLI